MCEFKIRVEQVCKDVVKAFPNELHRGKTAEKR